MVEQRLNKYLATNFGVSRREADFLIEKGSVLINDKVATIGQRVGDDDVVKVDGKEVKKQKLSYLALNKPAGYVCSRKRQGSTPTIYELLPPELKSFKSVGRLDKESSGLIILTNDGDFAFEMTHPKFYKTKKYTVALDRELAPLHQQMIADYGIKLNDGVSKMEFVFILFHLVGVPANHVCCCRFRSQEFTLKTNPFVIAFSSCTGKTVVFTTGCEVVIAD